MTTELDVGLLPPDVRDWLLSLPEIEQIRLWQRVIRRYKAIRDRELNPLWSPNPDHDDGRPNPQRLAIESEADELFYGGAAGGGKTDLLLGLALTKHKKSVILRRVFPNLAGIVDRSIEVVGSEDGYNKQSATWRLPGIRLEFESCQRDADQTKQQGRDRDFYGFDEITEFTRSMYLFIIGWNRTTDPAQRCRVVVTGNPPTDDAGSWVVEDWAPWLDPEFADPAEPGELRYYYYDRDNNIRWARSPEPVEDGGELYFPRSRTFIPARLDDNPHLASDGRYRARLSSLPEPLRSQLLFGDFSATAEPNPWQVIPTAWIRAAQRRWLEREPATSLSGVGVDPARGGRDRAAICKKYGSYFADPLAIPGRDIPDGPTLTARLAQYLGDEEPAYINMDLGGVGSSPYDTAREIWGRRVVGINAASKPTEGYTDRSKKFEMLNLRAEYHWRLREALDPEHGDDLALPNSTDVLAELAAANYSLTASGKIKVEAKEDIIERLGHSPDLGESILLANLVIPRKALLGVVAQGKAKGWQ